MYSTLWRASAAWRSRYHEAKNARPLTAGFPVPWLKGTETSREHREIAGAAWSRDSERAVALMNEHLQMTARVILDSVLSGREPAPKSAKAKPGEAYVPAGISSSAGCACCK